MNTDSVATTASGKKIYFNPIDRRGQDLAASGGNLNPFSLVLWNTALGLHPWDLIIDVGCNYGEMLVSADLPSNSEVVAFEPNPEVLPYLKSTLSQIGRPVILRERAVADAPSESASFLVDQDWSGTSSLPRPIPEGTFGHAHKRTHAWVGVTTLDVEFAGHPPGSFCLKIDVEGHEQAVLAGAQGLLGSTRLWAIVLEILHMPEDELSQLASSHRVYVLDKRSKKLVRLVAGNQLRRQMADEHLYLQDALIISEPFYSEFGDRISGAEPHNLPLPVPQGDTSAGRRVVYTALIGGYERLNDQPIATDSQIEFICFTDDPDLVSKTWTVRRVEPRFPRDPIRSARYLKIMGPELLENCDESLWIDNSIILRRTPESILDEWLSTAEFALPLHSFRDSVAAEFDAVDEAGYDDPARIYEQLVSYAAALPGALSEKPYWTALMARRHTSNVRAAMRFWYEQILRYSRRDQLSLNYALSVTRLPAAGIAIDNHESEAHQWPITRERKTNVTRSQLGDVLRIPHAEIGRLENTVMGLRSALAKEESSRRQIQNTEATLRIALAERACESEKWHQRWIDDVSAARNELNSMRSSTSWRATAPIRWIGSHFSDRGRHTMRRIARALWWATSPHRLPERIRLLRARKE